MVQYVSRDEQLKRKTQSAFVDRQEELDKSADKMPVPISGEYPYLMEIRTGIIHPYIPSLAERSDFVMGCYNLEGSTNPEDADPFYDPQAVRMRQERVQRTEQVGPQNMGEMRAEIANERRRIREEEKEKARADIELFIAAERERIREELIAEMNTPVLSDSEATPENTIETAPPTTTEPKKTRRKRQSKTSVETPITDNTPEHAVDNEITTSVKTNVVAEDTSENSTPDEIMPTESLKESVDDLLGSAFQEAMES